MSHTTELATLARNIRVTCVRGARRIRLESHPSLPAHHFSVLLCLSDHGPQCPTALAEYDNVTTPSMTRTLNSLVAEGLAVRTPHPTDGRRALVSITDRGRRAVAQATNDNDDWIVEHLGSLGEDQLQALQNAIGILMEMASGHGPLVAPEAG